MGADGGAFEIYLLLFTPAVFPAAQPLMQGHYLEGKGKEENLRLGLSIFSLVHYQFQKSVL